MTPAWGFLILATLMVVGGVALSWAGAVRRKRSYEEFILSEAKRTGVGNELSERGIGSGSRSSG